MWYGIIEESEGAAVLKEIFPLERAIEYIENYMNENIGLSNMSSAFGRLYELVSEVVSGKNCRRKITLRAALCSIKAALSKNIEVPHI